MKAFSLSDVRLTAGPTGHAQRVAAQYLLTLDPDRLLAPYLRQAGLPSPKPSYGNWESAGLEGHTAGHYLSGLAKMYAATGDAELKSRLDHVVDVVGRCQRQIGTGYVGGIVGGSELWEQIRVGDIVSDSFGLNRHWVPLYNLHKMFAGLLDAWRHGGNEQALVVVKAFAEWWLDLVQGVTEEQFQTMVATEFGGLNETFADLAAITDDPRYIAMAHRFSQPSLVEPLRAGRDELTGLHANTQIPKVVGYQRLAAVDVAATDLAEASKFFWHTVTAHRSVSIGANSVREHFNDRSDFTSMVTDRQGPETCNTYNMLKLTTMLFLDDPRPEYLDYYERATFNHILSTQHPEHGGLVYFTSMRPNHYRMYSDPHNCFWCCVGTGLENHAKYGELVYGHDATDLFVNLFIPTRLTWAERGLTMRQETDFPYAGQTRLVMEKAPTNQLTVHLRNPSWSAGNVQVAVNGTSVPLQDGPTGYLSLRRVWERGDTVTMQFDMPLRAEPLPASGDWTSFSVGPIVLAAASGHPTPPTKADDARMGHVASGPLAPQGDLAIIDESADPAQVLIPTGQPLRFRLADADQPQGVVTVLEPFFQLHDCRYTVYWPVAAASRMADRRAALRHQDLEDMGDRLLVDEVVVGEQQPESEHDYQGDSTVSGVVNDRRWRSSDRWFSYTLQDPDERAHVVRLEYRGVSEPRRFQIEINTVLLDEVVLPPLPADSLHSIDVKLSDKARPVDGIKQICLRAAPGSRTPDVSRIQLVASVDELSFDHA